MNIFVTDSCPVKSAQNLDDKRVIKMILESAQMLSAAMNVNGLKGPYKNTHVNHPCSIWCRKTKSNYVWLLTHFDALCSEYFFRYGKKHKCLEIRETLSAGVNCIPAGELTSFANCTPHKDMEIIAAYRLTMTEKWAADKRTPTWRTRFRPDW